MSFTTENHPGVRAEPPAATSAFVFTHSMLQVRDPALASGFYTRGLGRSLAARALEPTHGWGTALIRDTDGYRIEIIVPKRLRALDR